jgi:SIR2-like domain/CHAT domain
VGYHPTATIETQDLFPAIVSYVRAGRCVLFVGAGLSRAVGYPDWKELLEKLILDVTSSREGLTGRQELEALLKAGKYADVADQCREQIGPSQLFAFLRRELSGRRPRTQSHGAIARTPYRCIVTTNFDTLLEDAYAQWSNRGIPKAPCGYELAEHGTLVVDDAFFVLKAHGSITDAASIVFATEDYRRIVHASPAFQSVMSTLLMANAVLFVGYSLSDPNFRLLLESQLTTFGAQAPPRYAIMEALGPYERDLMERTMGIRALTYPRGAHEHVDALLQRLARASRQKPATVGSRASRALRAPRPLDTLKISIRANGPLLNVAWHEPNARRATAPGAEERTFDKVRPIPWSELKTLLQPVADDFMANPELVSVIGRILAATLPDQLLDALDSRTRQLVLFDLDAAAASLPWEWTMVGERPLLDRMAVARTMPNMSDEARGRPFPQAPLRALIIGDTRPTIVELNGKRMRLPGAAAEAKAIARAIEASQRGTRATLLLGSQATYAHVMQHLDKTPFDVIHFTGHAWVKDGAAYMALYDHAVYASELAMLLNRHPPALLFINSHHTGFVPAFTRVAPLDLPDRWSSADVHLRLGRRRFGFEYVAARVGVGSFVGCFGEPHDHVARVLAEAVYRELLDGAALADALHVARREAAPQGNITPYHTLMAGYPNLRLTAGRRK